MNNLTRLPKWAQTHIANLEHSLASTKRQLVAVETRDTEVFLWAGLTEDHLPLPPRSRIVFKTGPAWDDKFEVAVRDGLLEVYGNHQMKVMPWASNRVTVEQVR